MLLGYSMAYMEVMKQYLFLSANLGLDPLQYIQSAITLPHTERNEPQSTNHSLHPAIYPLSCMPLFGFKWSIYLNAFKIGHSKQFF